MLFEINNGKNIHRFALRRELLDSVCVCVRERERERKRERERERERARRGSGGGPRTTRGG